MIIHLSINRLTQWFLRILFISMLALTLVACGAGSDSAPDNGPAQEQEDGEEENDDEEGDNEEEDDE